jgi:outer membrane protein OmpA-like peptidoglycan-associated protein
VSRALAALGALALAGCAGGEIHRDRQAVAAVIIKARAAGAMRCAPVELAMAESHHDFARLELDEGDYFRAREELTIASENADEALARSSGTRCVGLDGDRDGVADADDRCPTEAEDKDGFEDEDGCPEADNDRDGLLDPKDGCPLQAEDPDGFADDDGCPDPDNDDDKLADRIDQCPDAPEDVDGFADDDGCPDCDNDDDGVPECPALRDKCPDAAGPAPDGCPAYKNVVVTADKIELKQTIFFDTRRTSIRRVSFALLDEVARALRDNPKIKVRIEGHTDSQGKAGYNLKLSRGRAAAVRTYLIGAGIDATRMESEGYGEDKPIADNRTDEGRAENRRVEFVIIGR